MSTSVEGDLDALFDLARSAHLRAFEVGAGSVLTTLRIHDNWEREPTIQDKTRGRRGGG